MRVATCHLCEKDMYESELLDHIEKVSHPKDIQSLPSFEAYKEWFKQNFTIEDRMLPPGAQPWLKDVHSFGIETRMRHD